MVTLRTSFISSYLRHTIQCLSSSVMEKDEEVKKDLVGIEKMKKLFFKGNDDAIVKTRSIVGSGHARQLSKDLFGTIMSSVSASQKDSHSSGPLDITFLQGLLLNDLRGDVSAKIKATQKLKEELDTWDQKISTFVSSKQILEKLVGRYPKLNMDNRYLIEEGMFVDRRHMLELQKKQQTMEPYQHIFYHLQTQPKYLSKLICQMSELDYTTLTEGLLPRLFKKAIPPREEYHFLKLLENAIQYEVKQNCTNIKDISEERFKSIKTAFSFYRKLEKCDALNKNLTPVINEIIHLQYFLTEKSFAIPGLADSVLYAVFRHVHSIPYGIRYVSKVLRQALHKKFPQATEDEVLETLGFFMYQYLLPFIICPGEAGIIVTKVKEDSGQKENLIVVAVLVGHLMSNILFPMERANAVMQNKYMVKTYPHFRRMFEDFFKIPEPEEEFGFNEYSDFTSLKEPVIRLTVIEIVDTLNLLSKYKKVVFPDQMDTLYRIFKSLGPVPQVKELLFGEDAVAASRGKALSKFQVYLTLDGKYISPKERNLTSPRALKDAKLNNLTNPKAGLSKSIDFQDILNNIAKDIPTKNEFQLQQKAEITKIRQAVDALSARSTYYQNHIDQYQRFWNSCLENLARQKSSNTGVTMKEKGTQRRR